MYMGGPKQEEQYPGAPPYPGAGGPPYPTAGGPPYPPVGGAPYPMGGAPYPTGGAPYPSGGAPYPPQGGDVYSTMGSGSPYGCPGQGGYPQPGYPPGSFGPPQGGYPPQGGGYVYGQPQTETIMMAQSGPYRHGGEGSNPEYGQEGFSGFTNPEVRQAFVRKVYTLLSIQLLVTAVIVYPFLYVEKFQEFADSHKYLMIVSMLVYVVLMMVLVCCEGVRRSFPLNLILLGFLTIAMGFVCGFATTRYKTEIVLLTLAMTCLVCIVVTLAACFLPVDITGCGTLMCVLSLAFAVFGIVATVCIVAFKMKIMILIYSGIAVALFSLYLMFDTQQIMGGKRVELSPEEYVLGALQLYIDIVEIFMNLLPLVAACFSDD